MGFIYPSFLWALLAIAIPIIIHLFYFRRFKTVYFTNVRFLKEVKEQTANRQKVRNLLVLISRILTIIFLVLAFAQPYFAKKGAGSQEGSKDISIYFDNTFSMSAESEDVRLLEKARSRAEEIMAAYGPNDRIQILTADFEGRDQRMLSKDDAISRIREIKTSFSVKDLTKVISRQKQALKSGNNKNKEIYIISDFQKNASDLSVYTDSIYKLNLIPLQSVQNRNVGIDTAWFESPVQSLNQPNALIVKVHNYSDVEMSNIRISMSLNGELRPGGTLIIPPKTSVLDTLNVTITKTGWYEAKLNATDYPIEFDNDYFFTFYVKEKVNLLEIHNGAANRFVQAGFKNNQYFVASNSASGQLDYSKLGEQDLLILSDLKSVSTGLASELKTYLENGGNVVVFPAKDAVLNDYNAFLKSLNANEYGAIDKRPRNVSYINFQDFIFFDVFEDKKDNLKLPSTKGNYKLSQRASSNEEVLLRYRDGGSFLGKYSIGKGNLFLCAAPLDTDFSDLVQNGEIFIPMLYRMALAGGKDRKIAYFIGKDNLLESDNKVSNNETVYKMGGESGEFIPEQRRMGSRLTLGINNQAKLAGFYKLYLKVDEVLDRFAFNYDRRESALEFFSAVDLKKLCGEEVTVIDGTYTRDFKNILAGEKKGTPIWKWCLILALVFLLAETLLLRLMSENQKQQKSVVRDQ
jgi:hypothetical protein